MSQRYNENIKEAKVKRKSARDLENLRILPKKISRGPKVQERALLGLRICL